MPVATLRNANAPATPKPIFLLECCGVADKTVILGSAQRWATAGLFPRHLSPTTALTAGKYFIPLDAP